MKTETEMMMKTHMMVQYISENNEERNIKYVNVFRETCFCHPRAKAVQLVKAVLHLLRYVIVMSHRH
jgi:hypothetical protein